MVCALVALLLAAPAWASAAGAAAVPQICTGWPSPDAPHVAATNYSNADLPDLLALLNGSRVTSAGPLWEARRAEIKHLLHRYFYGTLPDETPPLTNVSASPEVAVRGGAHAGASARARAAARTFGTPQKISLWRGEMRRWKSRENLPGAIGSVLSHPGPSRAGLQCAWPGIAHSAS